MEIKIAYLLLVHHKPEQANMFIEQILVDKDSEIFIHVDKKNQSIIERIKQDRRVHIYSEYTVEWASFEIVKATILLMEKALEFGEFTHVYYGSGQDLMLRKGFSEYLKEHQSAIFWDVHQHIVGKFKCMEARYKVRWSRWMYVRNDVSIERAVRGMIFFLYRLGINVKPNKKKLKIEYEFYRGSTWFISPIDMIQYIMDHLQKNKEYIDYWEDSLAADEFFFLTIVMNSEYKSRIIPSLMYIGKDNSLVKRNHPKIIVMEDVKLIENSNSYFGRKFDDKVDSGVIRYFWEKIIKCN